VIERDISSLYVVQTFIILHFRIVFTRILHKCRIIGRFSSQYPHNFTVFNQHQKLLFSPVSIFHVAFNAFYQVVFNVISFKGT